MQQQHATIDTLQQERVSEYRAGLQDNASLEESIQDQWQHVMESFFEATLCTDAAGKIVYCSPKTEAMFQRLGLKPHGSYFWKFLQMPVDSLEEALAVCDGNGMCRIDFFQERELALKLVPMSEMSGQKHAYTLLLMGLEGLPGGTSHKRQESAGSPLILAMARSVFEESPHSMVLVDREGHVVAANESAQDLFELHNGQNEEAGNDDEAEKATNYAGERLDTLLAAAEGEVLLEQLLSMNGQDFNCCCDLETPDGDLRPLEVHASKVDMEEGRFLYKLSFEDISDRKALEEGLQRKAEELEEMQITLRNVMRSAVQDKESLKEDIGHMIRVEVLPTLRKMSQEQDEELRSNYQEVIQDQLNGLAGTAQDEPDTLFYDLTPTELQVCEYIRAGHATKEISETMHLAFETVQTHRKNIRHKLGLKGRKVSLYMFLRSRGRMS